MSNKKYMDIEVISFLEEKMLSNTQHYRTDFEIDKKMLYKAANSDRREDKTLLWLSRSNGTLCVKEHEAFIKDTSAHVSWKFYAEQLPDDPIIAYAVELTGEKDGKLLGNVYELDYKAHVKTLLVNSVEPAQFEKTFEDGLVLTVSCDCSSYGFYAPFVKEHGPIIDSFTIPKEKYALSNILSSQRTKRRAMQEAELPVNKKPSLNNLISSAEEKAEKPKLPETTWITVYKDCLGIQDDMDNLTEICVPTKWLLNELKNEGITDFEGWLDEYTADGETEAIARKAFAEKVIIACDDLNIKAPAAEGKSVASKSEPIR